MSERKVIIYLKQKTHASISQNLFFPGYYMNLKQNPRTLLPKFFGLYCYSCNAKNVRIIVMNNLLPSGLKMHHKFDLKGTITYALCTNSRTVLPEKKKCPSQKKKIC